MEVQSQFIEMLSNSGYEEKSLGELCDKITDGSHNPPKGNDGSEYLMISSKNVFIDGLDLADVRYLSKDEFDLENKRTEVKKNDILLTIVGTIGRTYLVKGNEGNIVMQRSVAVLKPSDKVNPLFMMYSLHIDENLEKEGRGNAQKGVYLKQLSQFKIKVPSLDIQNNFCSIYQQADKSKFVGFKSQFIEMLSNSGYEEKSLGELCDKITDGSHNPPKGNDGSEYLMISSKNVFIDGLDLADVRYLSKDEFDLENKRTEVKKNDILLTIVGTIGRTYLVKGNEGNIVMQRSVAVLKPSDKVNPLFMMYSLHIDENLEKEGRGNAQKGVYLKQLSQFKIKVPSLDIQNNFCSIYQQADKSKYYNQVA